jgi:chemotaxis protein histidine kinase CheA
MNPNTAFDELFALRILFQDEFENENDIICELKYELIKRGTPIENIPNILKQFYDFFGINMTIEQINEALYPIHEEEIGNQFFNILNNYITYNNQATNNQATNNQATNNQATNNQATNNQETNNQETNNQEINNQEINNQETNNQATNNQEINNQETNNQETNNQETNNQETNNQNNENYENENYENENYEDENYENENYEDENYENENYEDENYEDENYEDISSNLNNFLNNNQNNGNIQFTFFSPNFTNSIRTIQYTFNRESISQSSLHLRNILNPLIIVPSFSQSLFNPLLSEPIMEDVVSTLDDSEKDKLKVYKLIEKKEEKCTICMSEINIDEHVCDLPCTHTFHNECIQPWLNHYNYKCPICRKEVGKPKYNI